MTKNSKGSLIALILAMVIFGTIGIFRRYTPLPSATLAFLRGIIGSAFLIILVKIRGKRLSGGVDGKTFRLLAITGALIGLNWVALFESYNYTTVATATLCYYMEPTIVILLSPIFLKERLTLKKGICALLAVVGMLFVSGAFESWFTGGHGANADAGLNVTGIVLGLAAAALYSIVVIMNKRLAGIDPYKKTIIQLASAAIILIPYMFISAAVSDGTEAAQAYGFAGKLSAAVLGSAPWGEALLIFTPLVIIMILIMGFVHTGGAYALYFGSIDGLQGQTVAIMSYIDPVVSLILSAIILKERMSTFGIIGAVLIIGAALAAEIDLKRFKKQV